jgi:hypothetical protein
MSDIIIKVENLSKLYKIGVKQERYKTLRDTIVNAFGELIFLQKKLTTGIILFRVKIQKSQEKMKLMKKLLMGYREKLFKHFIVITKDRIRIIPIGDRT